MKPFDDQVVLPVAIAGRITSADIQSFHEQMSSLWDQTPDVAWAQAVGHSAAEAPGFIKRIVAPSARDACGQAPTCGPNLCASGVDGSFGARHFYDIISGNGIGTELIRKESNWSWISPGAGLWPGVESLDAAGPLGRWSAALQWIKWAYMTRFGGDPCASWSQMINESDILSAMAPNAYGVYRPLSPDDGKMLDWLVINIPLLNYVPYVLYNDPLVKTYPFSASAYGLRGRETALFSQLIQYALDQLHTYISKYKDLQTTVQPSQSVTQSSITAPVAAPVTAPATAPAWILPIAIVLLAFFLLGGRG